MFLLVAVTGFMACPTMGTSNSQFLRLSLRAKKARELAMRYEIYDVSAEVLSTFDVKWGADGELPALRFLVDAKNDDGHAVVAPDKVAEVVIPDGPPRRHRVLSQQGPKYAELLAMLPGTAYMETSCGSRTYYEACGCSKEYLYWHDRKWAGGELDRNCSCCLCCGGRKGDSNEPRHSACSQHYTDPNEDCGAQAEIAQ